MGGGTLYVFVADASIRNKKPKILFYHLSEILFFGKIAHAL